MLGDVAIPTPALICKIAHAQSTLPPPKQTLRDPIQIYTESVFSSCSQITRSWDGNSSACFWWLQEFDCVSGHSSSSGCVDYSNNFILTSRFTV